MDETFNSGFQLDEGPKVHQTCDGPGNPLAGRDTVL